MFVRGNRSRSLRIACDKIAYEFAPGYVGCNGRGAFINLLPASNSSQHEFWKKPQHGKDSGFLMQKSAKGKDRPRLLGQLPGAPVKRRATFGTVLMSGWCLNSLKFVAVGLGVRDGSVLFGLWSSS